MMIRPPTDGSRDDYVEFRNRFYCTIFRLDRDVNTNNNNLTSNTFNIEDIFNNGFNNVWTLDHFLNSVRRWGNEDNEDEGNELYIYNRPNNQIILTNRGRFAFEDICRE
jgi:hypothetical protein